MTRRRRAKRRRLSAKLRRSSIYPQYQSVSHPSSMSGTAKPASIKQNVTFFDNLGSAVFDFKQSKENISDIGGAIKKRKR